jgi:excisionase family DNA binding protein
MRQKRTNVLQVARILKGARAAWSEREEAAMAQERLMRPREVAQRLAVSRSTVYRWFWEGKLKGIKITGGTVRILESAVRDKMAEAY